VILLYEVAVFIWSSERENEQILPLVVVFKWVKFRRTEHLLDSRLSRQVFAQSSPINTALLYSYSKTASLYSHLS